MKSKVDFAKKIKDAEKQWNARRYDFDAKEQKNGTLSRKESFDELKQYCDALDSRFKKEYSFIEEAWTLPDKFVQMMDDFRVSPHDIKTYDWPDFFDDTRLNNWWQICDDDTYDEFFRIAEKAPLKKSWKLFYFWLNRNQVHSFQHSFEEMNSDPSRHRSSIAKQSCRIAFKKSEDPEDLFERCHTTNSFEKFPSKTFQMVGGMGINKNYKTEKLVTEIEEAYKNSCLKIFKRLGWTVIGIIKINRLENRKDLYQFDCVAGLVNLCVHMFVEMSSTDCTPGIMMTFLEDSTTQYGDVLEMISIDNTTNYVDLRCNDTNVDKLDALISFIETVNHAKTGQEVIDFLS